MNNKTYITTTLPYVNAEPHIGHALEFVQAYTIARYFRQKLGKENVFFNVGTDEHGQKIFKKAQEENISIQQFVDKYSNRFKEYCKLFFVEYDNFYRTSTKEHAQIAQKFWTTCKKNGDIYKKQYSGYYCVGCERFITEKELVDGKCPDHATEPELKEEENYFFKSADRVQIEPRPGGNPFDDAADRPRMRLTENRQPEPTPDREHQPPRPDS